MAFQQQRPQPARQLSLPQNATDAVIVPPQQRKRTIEESQEWILFSPVNEDEGTSVTGTATHTSQTPRTATHLSDFGSLETHVRSQPLNSNDSSGIRIDDISEAGEEHDDDGADLDSLDDGLHAFHHPFSSSSNLLDLSGGAVLPTHDGLGTFPSGTDFQEHLWQFERYNPQRRNTTRQHLRRRSSAQRRLEAIEDEQELDVAGVVTEADRTARVEKWRIDQSRAVLEEIERETRRMRRIASRMGSASNITASRVLIPSHSAVLADAASTPPQSESIWRRITRRVIRDLIGLDESTLSVILGETVAADKDDVDDVETEQTPTQPSPLSDAVSRAVRDEQSWELRLLETIARELGLLVHQLTEHNHEGAFSTYKRMQEMPIEYAGLGAPRQASLRSRRRAEAAKEHENTSETVFSPTVQPAVFTPTTEHGDTSLWGIEEEEEAQERDRQAEAREREYWEQEVDIKMIFTYLKSRFLRRSSSPPADEGPLPASWAASNTATALGTSPESLRRAEVIRRHHPLVSRAAKRDSMLRRHQALQRRAVVGGGIAVATVAGAGSSSCASQSTKRSRTASSRHYWSSASGHGSGGALGGWGEV